MKMIRFDKQIKQKWKSRKISKDFNKIPGSKILGNSVPKNPGIEILDPARAWLCCTKTSPASIDSPPVKIWLVSLSSHNRPTPHLEGCSEACISGQCASLYRGLAKKVWAGLEIDNCSKSRHRECMENYHNLFHPLCTLYIFCFYHLLDDLGSREGVWFGCLCSCQPKHCFLGALEAKV